MPSPATIAPAATAQDFAAVDTLFRAYAASLPIDLRYQDFAMELAHLPGRYAAPRGLLLLARAGDGRPVGCAALRPLDDPATCEMKRLYVDPAARGLSLGRDLVDALIGGARALGYAAMLLDTLDSMTAALALYRAAGFGPIDPYYATPVAGTLFLRRAL